MTDTVMHTSKEAVVMDEVMAPSESVRLVAPDLMEEFETKFAIHSPEEMTLTEYLDRCKTDPMCYAFAAQRMVNAIGDPVIIDTSKVPRLARLFGNTEIRTYEAFADFYGMEDTIENIVNFFRHAAQGLEEARQIIYLLGPVGCGKCEVGSTLVTMSDGTYKEIKDLVVGDQVLSMTAQNKTVVKRVTNTFKLGEKTVFGLRTSRGLIVRAAKTHHFMTQYGWESIDELQPRTLIATARIAAFGNAHHDHDELKVLAYLLGDGHIGFNNIGFTCANETILEDCQKSVRELGCTLVPQSQTMDADYVRLYPYSYRINSSGSNRVKEMLTDWKLLGKNSPSKFIPDFIFRLNERDLSVFLSRLYGTDGWASVDRGKKRKSEIGYCTTSRIMAEQLLRLLSKYGICARLMTKIPKLNGVEHLPAHQVVIRDKDHIRIFLNRIKIYGKRDACLAVLNNIERSGESGGADRIPKNLVRAATDNLVATKTNHTSKLKDQLRTQIDDNRGVRRVFVERAAKLLTHDVVCSAALAELANSDVYWDEVVAVENLGYSEEMYDIEVEDCHNYIANGVVSHNSSIVARLRDLMESRPIYVLGYRTPPATSGGVGKTEWSPYFSRVLPLFEQAGMAKQISGRYNIPMRYIEGITGPWERKRLAESKGNLTNFRVLKLYPSRFQQVALAEAEPGDENTQDISTLVGKVDMRKLEEYSQNDPDAYLYSGALNLTNQGLMEFKEMFKAKIKMLHPLLFAVQEHNYQGTENIGALPYNGIVMAHSNETEWKKFQNNRENEAFLDRICIVKVPYCLRYEQEIEIYQKSIQCSELAGKPIAPGTLEILAMFSCMSRLKEPQNSSLYSKLKVYNGENLREKDPRAKTYQEYREDAENREEGFFPAISTRWAFKRLSQCFNADAHEIAADPIHMMRVLLTEIEKDFTPEQEATFKKVIKDIIKEQYYFPYLDREIRGAYLESYADYGQNLFDRYFMWAEKWVNSEDYFDPSTGLSLNKEALDAELSKLEKPADISNPKDFRNEVVNWILRYQAKNYENPSWRAFEKLKGVIEKTMFSNTQDLLPVISFAKKASQDEEKKHTEFVDRMKDKGYTERQIRRIVDWYLRVTV